MLNTVRWSGAYLCGMGEHWSVDEFASRKGAELLEAFFSWEMIDVRSILQCVEWKIEVENGYFELLSINQDDVYRQTKLTGEMSTAYGTGFDPYFISWSLNNELYSFEIESLVGSYRASDRERIRQNRKSVNGGLAHTVVLAKHLGTEKLKAIRQYYDRYRVPVGFVRENAFKLLLK